MIITFAREPGDRNHPPLVSVLLAYAIALTPASTTIAAEPVPPATDSGVAAGPGVEDAPTVGGDHVTFRLGPADGTSFIQVLHTQRDRSMDGIGKEEARAIGRTRYAVERNSDGWTYKGRLVSSQATRDGKPFDDPYGLVLTDVEVEIEVADDGSVRAVRGYDAVARRASKLLSPEIAEKLKPFMGTRALEERAISDWRGRVGDFVGLTVSIGDTRTETLSYEIPGGVELQYDVETRFAGWTTCPVGQCLRIETTYDSATSRATTAHQPADADGSVDASAGGSAGAAAHADESPSAVTVERSRIAGSSTRLVDPSTMLIYSEQEERTVWAMLEIEGLGPVPLVEVATMTYSYEYQ